MTTSGPRSRALSTCGHEPIRPARALAQTARMHTTAFPATVPQPLVHAAAPGLPAPRAHGLALRAPAEVIASLQARRGGRNLAALRRGRWVARRAG